MTVTAILEQLDRGGADQRAREQEELERKILEGLDSPAREMTPEDWQELRSTLRRKLTKRRRAR